MKDFRGIDIAVGDTIVYPGRVSSSIWMNEGTVMEILPKGLRVAPVLRPKLRRHDEFKTGRTSIVTAIDRVTVVAR